MGQSINETIWMHFGNIFLFLFVVPTQAVLLNKETGATLAPDSWMCDPVRTIFLGPPGCGKGTQSDILNKDRPDLLHISTGDLLRKTTNASIKEKLDNGQLVDDQLVLTLIRDELTHSDNNNSFILDGFPRTLAQAEMLDVLLKEINKPLTSVIYFHVSDDEVAKRICGRWSHPPSGRTYHVDFKPPKVPGLDDVTGEALTQRKDDNEESLKTRLTSYHEKTEPLKDYYTKANLLKQVDAAAVPATVHEKLVPLLC